MPCDICQLRSVYKSEFRAGRWTRYCEVCWREAKQPKGGTTILPPRPRKLGA